MPRVHRFINGPIAPVRPSSLLAALLFAVLLLYPGAVTFGDVAAPLTGKKPLIEGTDSRPRRFQKLRERAREQGTVRIIFRLNTPFIAEGRLGGAGEIADQRKEIARGQERALKRLEGSPFQNVKQFEHIPYLALELPEESLALLEGDPQVTDIEEDSLSSPAWNDTIEQVGADKAWNYGYTGAGWTVALLDTGVEITHPYFQGRIVGGACYSNLCGAPAGVNCNPGEFGSTCNHGTYVSGIIAANSGGPTRNGVAKGANIMPIQVFSDTGGGKIDSSKSDQLLALQYVYNQRLVYQIAAVNISVHGELHADQASCDAANPSAKAMFDLLRSVGIATVVPSGNDGNPSALAYPACISSAVSVGGTYGEDQIAGFSDSADYLSLLAPGAGVCSTTFQVWGGWTCEYAGTSLAAPHVAGAWAVLKQAVPEASVDEILTILKSTGVPVTDPRNGLTKARIQVDAALKALDHTAPQSQMTALPTVSGIPFLLSWSGTDEESGLGSYDVQVREGYEGVWTDFLLNTSQTSVSFTGSHGQTYLFRVRARDRIGNLEPYGYGEWGQTFTTVLTSPAPVLVTSSKFSDPRLFQDAHQTLSYTIRLQNTGNQAALASLEDTPPSSLTILPGTLAATSGLPPAYLGGKISWAGTIPVSGEVQVTYDATPNPGLPWLIPQTNTVRIFGSVLGPFARSAEVIRAHGVWIPLIRKTAP
jgi:subtilisin